MVEATLPEIMVVATAREIKDKEIVLVGAGLPMIASALAKKTHAPNAILTIELGIVDYSFEVLTRPGMAFGGPMMGNARMICGMSDVLGTILQGGYVDVGVVGGAQVDKYGNVNSTVIGDYFKPKTRLPGSGGANDVASSAKRFVIIMPHEKRRIVEKVDFITTPGYLDGPGAREKAGLKGGGPSCIITTMGVFRFDPETKEAYLETIYPGITIDQVRENSAYEIKMSPELREMTVTDEEIKALRELDQFNIYKLRKQT